MNAPRWIRTRNTSNKRAIDLRITPRGHCDWFRAQLEHKYSTPANCIVENCALLRYCVARSGNFAVGKELLGFSTL